MITGPTLTRSHAGGFQQPLSPVLKTETRVIIWRLRKTSTTPEEEEELVLIFNQEYETWQGGKWLPRKRVAMSAAASLRHSTRIERNRAKALIACVAINAAVALVSLPVLSQLANPSKSDENSAHKYRRGCKVARPCLRPVAERSSGGRLVEHLNVTLLLPRCKAMSETRGARAPLWMAACIQPDRCLSSASNTPRNIARGILDIRNLSFRQ